MGRICRKYAVGSGLLQHHECRHIRLLSNGWKSRGESDMLLIINVIAIYASFALNQMLAIYWGAVLPTLYAIVVAPQALIERSGIPPATITRILATKWNNAEDLTKYIVKYWMALATSTTSWKKQRDSVILYLTAFFLGAIYIFKELFAAGMLMLAVGYVLYRMSIKVDRPRSVYASPEFKDGSYSDSARKEWDLAAMAIIAFSDLYPDDEPLQESASQVLEDGDVKLLLAKYRYANGAS